MNIVRVDDDLKSIALHKLCNAVATHLGHTFDYEGSLSGSFSHDPERDHIAHMSKVFFYQCHYCVPKLNASKM